MKNGLLIILTLNIKKRLLSLFFYFLHRHSLSLLVTTFEINKKTKVYDPNN